MWVPNLQCQNDQYIMDLAAQHLTKKQLLHINMCRMVVQTVTILDLATHDGRIIHKKYFTGQEGNSGRCSNYLWPKLAYPPRHYWQTWWFFLSTVIGYPSLFVPLGNWNMFTRYSHDLEYKFDPIGELLYRFDDKLEMWTHFE